MVHQRNQPNPDRNAQMIGHGPIDVSQKPAFGEPNWPNRTLYIADCYDVMCGMDDETVDKIYLDPPFNSNQTYTHPLKGDVVVTQSFDDFWTMDKVRWDQVEALQGSVFEPVIRYAEQTGGEPLLAYTLYMIPRLQECYRILKRTGSLYFHCDDRVCCVMEMVLSTLFGSERRRQNHLAWRRALGSKNNVKTNFGRDIDHILFYTKSATFTFNVQYGELSAGGLAPYKYDDNDGRGRYRLDNVAAPRTSKSAKRYGLGYGEKMPKYGYRWTEHEMRHLIAEGRILIRPGKVPAYKRYLSESLGVPQSNLALFHPIGKAEDTGWSTQKPLELLECLVLASSNPGDVVFDPFCGCATTLVAAERHGRRWIGCDIDPAAEVAVKVRLQEETDSMPLVKGVTTIDELVNVTREPPLRSEPDHRMSPNIREILYEQQGGRCAAPCDEDTPGMGIALPLRLFELDHIVPKSRGGTDVDSNMQLLCPSCNRKKSNKLWSDFLDEFNGGGCHHE